MEKALVDNILMSHLDSDQRKEVFDAMFKVDKKKGDIIIAQGDKGDNFYVLDSGSCEIDVDGKVVANIQPGGSFGELALIYGSPRAATVKATSDCILWAVERGDYRRIMMDTTMQKRELYEKFLTKVPILSELTQYERLTVADALEPVEYKEGEAVVKQGTDGDDFFMIVEGSADVVKKVDGKESVVNSLAQGGFFGEIALLTNSPRQASVIAKTHLKCVKLDRSSFMRVLGPIEDILRRNLTTYKKYIPESPKSAAPTAPAAPSGSSSRKASTSASAPAVPPPPVSK